MRILMMTNTYSPHVGGVARSVEAFSGEMRRRGHETLVVAPAFDGAPDFEPGVTRVPALQNFNGGDFSVRIPIPGFLDEELDAFRPQVVHAHHPFLMGDTALRIAASRELPLVFTHHTLYERYTHYSPLDSPALARFVVTMAVGYCNLCDRVIAPSESVARMLADRGVTRPVTTIPTGVVVERFAAGDGAGFRRSMEPPIPPEAFVAGHVGRLAPEKNLAFLGRCVARFLHSRPGAVSLFGGAGPMESELRGLFEREGLLARVRFAGMLEGDRLTGAYRAMDVFAFASTSETQGMVLVEAMAAGAPVVAIDAPGAREVVTDANGALLFGEDEEAFAAALAVIHDAPPPAREALRAGARATADRLSLAACAERLASLYEDAIAGPILHGDPLDEEQPWYAALRLIEVEWARLTNFVEATAAAIGLADPLEPPAPETSEGEPGGPRPPGIA